MRSFARLTLPLFCVLFAIFPCARAAGAIAIMDPDEIKVGMTGIGKSVFKGTVPEEFKFEVLGVMKKAYASHDMILVKCSGANLEHTGIIAGMSGSPVYIDGKLIGAVSMTYGFQKDAIAEVTPARDMIDIMERTDLPDQGMTPGDDDWGMASSEIQNPKSRSPIPDTRTPVLRPIPCPVTISGFDNRLCAVFGPGFEQYGMQLMPGSGAVASSAPDTQHPTPDTRHPILEPGSAVGVSLISGDMNAAGIGTVTAVDGDRMVAFGHPMFQGGAVNMPMIGGVIHTIMASEELSFKIFSPTEPIGAITQDRASGIAGTIGPKVPMIPVHVTLQAGGRQEEYHYELLNHPKLTPMLLNVAVVNAITSREQATFDFTARADIALKLRGYPVIHNHRWFTGDAVLNAAAREISDPLDYLMSNEFEKVAVESIAVNLELTPGTQFYQIDRVTTDRARAKPGDNLQLTVALEGYRAPGRTERLDVAIPREAPEGDLLVLVTTPDTALSVALDAAGEKIEPHSVPQMIKLLEQVGEENQIIVQGYIKKKGVVIAGEKFPNLPPSMFSLLDGTRQAGTTNETSTSLLFEKRYPMDRIVTGGQIVHVNIER